jgi:hypothetical protein
MSCDLTSSWIRTLQRAQPLTASVWWMGRLRKQRATAPMSGGQTVFESCRGRGLGVGGRVALLSWLLRGYGLVQRTELAKWSHTRLALLYYICLAWAGS